MYPDNEDRQSSPLLLRRRLGNELRRLRDAAGISTEEVATHLYCSISKISRIETARVAATPRDVRDMLDLYQVTGQPRDALMQLASEARQKEAWWHAHGDVPDVRTYVSFEEAAQSICAYSAALVPGLLQAEEYARAIIGVVYPQLLPHEVERHVKLRMARQSILAGKDPPTLQAVFDEEALHRLVGGRRAMRNQVHRLVESAAMPNVTLQVISFQAGQHGGLLGPFTILNFPDPADHDVVHLEHSAGELYLDSADQVCRYRALFESLQEAALAPDDSTAFIAKRAETLGALRF